MVSYQKEAGGESASPSLANGRWYWYPLIKADKREPVAIRGDKTGRYLMEEDQRVRLCSGEEGIEETVDVIPLGANDYRLGSTLLTLGDEKGDRLYVGDVIEAEAQENGVLRFCRVVERSTWHHWDWLLPQEVFESSAFKSFQRAIVANGGEWEQVWGGMFIAHLPQGSAFDLEAEFKNVLLQVAMAFDGTESTRARPLYKRIWRKIGWIFQKRSQTGNMVI